MDIEGNERPKYSFMVIPEVPDTMSVSPNNVFVIFDRAFTFFEEFRELKSSAQLSKASATLLYNMGMALHQVGVQESNTAALRKSLRAYKILAYSALWRLSELWRLLQLSCYASTYQQYEHHSLCIFQLRRSEALPAPHSPSLCLQLPSTGRLN
jgi:hypothetical protein